MTVSGSSRVAEILICGAGIAGVAAAYELAVRRSGDRKGKIVLVDPLPPLSLTSDKSTECYRNWWPGPGSTMVRFMDRSIDLLEEMTEASDDRFAMNRNGYAYFTAEPARALELERAAREISGLGAGELRVHRGEMSDPLFPDAPHDKLDRAIGGADLVLDPQTIRCRYPFLNPATRAMLHPRRCGWLSAQQLGMWMLERARAAGVELLEGSVVGIRVEEDGVRGVDVRLPSGAIERIATRALVNAAGPLAPGIGRMAGLDLPLVNELHGKVYLEDVERVVPRDLPLMIWCDPVTLDWSDEERAELEADADLAHLARTLPGGVHFRPEGGVDSHMLLLLFTYHLAPVAPVWPPRFDPWYPEVVLRALTHMVPGFAIYLGDRMKRPFVDGGYYCKTPENRLLVGPTPVPGFHLLCGLSGYGIMAAAAAAELLGATLCGSPVPEYATDLRLDRYQDPTYRARLDRGEFASGQL
ncbi:MAG: FAD-dependent oxidoreductase [Thermoanaerobaculia bacterium]